MYVALSKTAAVAVVLHACLALLLSSGAHAKSILKDPRGWLRDVEHSARVDAENLRERADRDIRNTGRWIREDSCQRERRKHGDAAYHHCMAKSQGSPQSRPSTGSHLNPTAYAIMEVSCVMARDGWRYGSFTISHSTRGTRQDAMRVLLNHYNSNHLCQQRFGRADLLDRYRWVHH